MRTIVRVLLSRTPVPGVLVLMGGLLAVPTAVNGAVQDTLPIEQGVRVGITYTPGMRPGMLVLGGPRLELLDSARAILARDLDFSDRFEMITLPGGDSLILGVEGSGGPDGNEHFVNYSLYAVLGADFAVGVLPGRDTSVTVQLYDVRGENVRVSVRIPRVDPRSESFRLMVHRAADEVVRGATGEPGIAASRIVLVSQQRVYVVGADGHGLTAVSPPTVEAFAAAWDPSGRRITYSELADGWGTVVVQDLVSGVRSVVGPTRELLNISPKISPDGTTMVFARIGDTGSDIYSYNLARDCCLQRLTVGRLSDNVSPAYSPDGRRIAFESTRVGLSQIYVMSSDGTDQELLAPFDYGVTGSSHSPAWSPDGLRVAFHRTVDRTHQVFVMDVRSRTVRQLTSLARNEDPTWAPDSRHLAFISTRAGSKQVWIIDIETGRVRQLTSIRAARIPEWSPRIAESNEP